jgi:hypothetical protein
MGYYSTVFCLKCERRLPGQLDHGIPCQCITPVAYVGKWDDMLKESRRRKAKEATQ